MSRVAGSKRNGRRPGAPSSICTFGTVKALALAANNRVRRVEVEHAARPLAQAVHVVVLGLRLAGLSLPLSSTLTL